MPPYTRGSAPLTRDEGSNCGGRRGGQHLPSPRRRRIRHGRPRHRPRRHEPRNRKQGFPQVLFYSGEPRRLWRSSDTGWRWRWRTGPCGWTRSSRSTTARSGRTRTGTGRGRRKERLGRGRRGGGGGQWILACPYRVVQLRQRRRGEDPGRVGGGAERRQVRRGRRAVHRPRSVVAGG